jgi:hypothetical protein
MKIKNLLLITCISLLFGCSESPTLTEEVSVGKVIDSVECVTTWYYNTKTMITTEKSIIYVWGTHSVMKGENAIIQYYSNNTKYFCLESEPECWIMF